MKAWGNIPNDAGFLYGIRDFIPTQGKGPRSVVATGGKIYTANYYTSELVSMDLNGKNVQKQVLGAPLAFTKVGKGDMYFHDATICFQNWQSCATCHPNDARMDGLNWDLLNDGMGNPKNTKTLLLSHHLHSFPQKSSFPFSLSQKVCHSEDKDWAEVSETSEKRTGRVGGVRIVSVVNFIRA